MKKKIIITLIITIILATLVSLFFILKKEDYTFNLDKDGQYEIITNMRFQTMLNDGGSHTNVYYQIDLEKKMVIKIQENYKANIGGTPESKKETLYEKKISSKLKNELESTITNAIKKEDINDGNYNFYVINTKNDKKDIYNTDTIKDIEEVLNKIDKEN